MFPCASLVAACDAAKHFGGADPAKVKQAHGALLEFVLESAKSDLEPEDVASTLEEASVSDKLAATLVEAFREQKVRSELPRERRSHVTVFTSHWP